MYRHSISNKHDASTCKRRAAMHFIADGKRARKRAGAAVAVLLAAIGIVALVAIAALFIT